MLGDALYYGEPINIEFPFSDNNDLQIGKVLLTKVGEELAPICGSVKSESFTDYVVSEWSKLGYITSCPIKSRVKAS